LTGIFASARDVTRLNAGGVLNRQLNAHHLPVMQ
jgi:hypothetical protein